MNVSSVANCTPRKNLFMRYANSFMSAPSGDAAETAEKANTANPETKIDKVKGLETLTIFPKQVIEGRTIITA